MLALLAAMTLSSAAIAQTESRSLFLKTAEDKGYGKRDRVFLGSDQNISPAQLHEIYGARLDAGLQFNNGTSRFANNEKAEFSAPSATVRGFWSGDIVAIGLGGNVSQMEVNSARASRFNEQQSSTKFLPQAAITLTPNFTFGAASDVNWMNLRQDNDTTTERGYGFYTRRESIGLSFHTPKLEIGVVHVTGSQASATSSAGEPVLSFGLLPVSTDDAERAVYAAPHNMIFARGNLTDHLSLHGSLAHTQYDDNMTGAKNEFDNYRIEDRLAAQFQAVWWLANRKTRFAVTSNFSGATYAPFGTEESSLGYRDANLYGGSADAIFSIGGRSYLGGSIGLMRGERDKVTNGERAVAREERVKLATTLNVNL